MCDVRWGWTLDAESCLDTGQFHLSLSNLGRDGACLADCRGQLDEVVDFLAEPIPVSCEPGTVVRPRSTRALDEPLAKHLSLDDGENVFIGERDGECEGERLVLELRPLHRERPRVEPTAVAEFLVLPELRLDAVRPVVAQLAEATRKILLNIELERGARLAAAAAVPVGGRARCMARQSSSCLYVSLDTPTGYQ